ncbi:hypothetical protein J6590_021002 [Homalodisca vitripennis]|nr:hypothetical protein J6590_021002 [Homalodisca vitripennis]
MSKLHLKECERISIFLLQDSRRTTLHLYAVDFFLREGAEAKNSPESRGPRCCRTICRKAIMSRSAFGTANIFGGTRIYLNSDLCGEGRACLSHSLQRPRYGHRIYWACDIGHARQLGDFGVQDVCIKSLVLGHFGNRDGP